MFFQRREFKNVAGPEQHKRGSLYRELPRWLFSPTINPNQSACDCHAKKRPIKKTVTGGKAPETGEAQLVLSGEIFSKKSW
jgi:hypothetical protein